MSMTSARRKSGIYQGMLIRWRAVFEERYVLCRYCGKSTEVSCTRELKTVKYCSTTCRQRGMMLSMKIRAWGKNPQMRAIRAVYDDAVRVFGPGITAPVIVENSRVCVQCGVQFEPFNPAASGAYHQRYCSAKCRDRFKGKGKSTISAKNLRIRRMNEDKALLLMWKSRGCEDCGEKDAQVLDAHHIDKSVKRNGKDVLSRCMGKSRSRFQAHLKACIPLCRNCHAKRHALERMETI